MAVSDIVMVHTSAGDQQKLTVREEHERCLARHGSHFIVAGLGVCARCGLTEAAVRGVDAGAPGEIRASDHPSIRTISTPLGAGSTFFGPHGTVDRWEDLFPPVPNLDAVETALYFLLEDAREIFALAYSFWRTDSDVIRAVHERADFRFVGGSRLDVSTGRQERAFIIAWRTDLLGLRTKWLEHTWQARSL